MNNYGHEIGILEKNARNYLLLSRDIQHLPGYDADDRDFLYRESCILYSHADVLCGANGDEAARTRAYMFFGKTVSVERALTTALSLVVSNDNEEEPSKYH